jgi:hypothetical protein
VGVHLKRGYRVVKMIRKIAVIIAVLFLIPIVSAQDVDTVREAGAAYSQGEVMMVHGPFYVAEEPYYVIDYMLLSEVQASLVYDPAGEKFVTDSITMRKVLATKDLKNLVIWDPLFYAIGDPTKIPLAAKFETQNVRNFAEFASINEDEKESLYVFLETYERIFEGVSECSKETNAMLYPEDAYLFEYSRTPPNIKVEVYKSSESGYFSFEGFEGLIECYDEVYTDYLQLGLDLNGFAGGLEEYPPGTTIREKWEVVLTKEGLLREIELVGANARILDEKIAVRKDILSYPYDIQINTGRERMGLPPTGAAKKVCGPTAILLLSLSVLFVFRYRRRLLGPSVLLLSPLLLVGVAASSSSDITVPSYEELISQKITNVSEVEIEIVAGGITEETARDIIVGFPLLLEGESVIVRGPYYYYGNPNYIIDIVEDGKPTGNLILIDGSTHRLVANQQTAFQLQKARFLADMIEGKALYQNVDPGALAAEAEKTDVPPLQIFLTNLSINAEEGKELEQRHVEKPDFETAKDLAQHYIKASALLKNIERTTSPVEGKAVTHGFSEHVLWLEAYGRVTKGLSADEYLEARRSMHRGRSLNRLPLMQQLAGMGMSPSKAQVVHDLTSDLIYDNTFLWHMGRVEDPNLFARLAFKEGTYTVPSSMNTSYTP